MYSPTTGLPVEKLFSKILGRSFICCSVNRFVNLRTSCDLVPYLWLRWQVFEKYTSSPIGTAGRAPAFSLGRVECCVDHTLAGNSRLLLTIHRQLNSSRTHKKIQLGNKVSPSNVFLLRKFIYFAGVFVE